jgi:hypothetical protein
LFSAGLIILYNCVCVFFVSHEIICSLGSRQLRPKRSKQANNGYCGRNSSSNICVFENAPNKIRIQKRQRFWLTSDFFCSEPTLAIDVPLKTKQNFVARGLAQVKTAFCSMRLSIWSCNSHKYVWIWYRKHCKLGGGFNLLEKFGILMTSVNRKVG